MPDLEPRHEHPGVAGRKRIAAHRKQNDALSRRGARVMDEALGLADYLVGGRFSVTDIIASFTVQWSHSHRLIDNFPHLQAYLARLSKREHCTLRPVSVS